MKTFLKVFNPVAANKLLELGFTYISREGSVYVYENKDEIVKALDAMTKDMGEPLYAIDTKLRFKV